jgi:hypothetical protein
MYSTEYKFLNTFLGYFQFMDLEGISCTELLQRVYKTLFYEQVEEVVEIDRPIEILVADDSDYHRIRQGFMIYTEGKVVALEKSHWFIGKGKPHGSYPAERYLGDIRVWKGKRPGPFPRDGFSNSALIITRNNNIATSKVGIFKGLSDLTTKIDKYDLTPNERYTIVKPEFVDIAVRRIEEILRNHTS